MLFMSDLFVCTTYRLDVEMSLVPQTGTWLAKNAFIVLMNAQEVVEAGCSDSCASKTAALPVCKFHIL